MKVSQSCPGNPKDYTVHGILQARILESVAYLFSRGSSQPRDGTQVLHIAGGSPTSQVDSLLVGPQGKPKKTGVGSLSLLQGIFRTLELNQGLLHCKQILYQLSYERNLIFLEWFSNLFSTFIIYTVSFQKC